MGCARCAEREGFIMQIRSCDVVTLMEWNPRHSVILRRSKASSASLTIAPSGSPSLGKFEPNSFSLPSPKVNCDYGACNHIDAFTFEKSKTNSQANFFYQTTHCRKLSCEYQSVYCCLKCQSHTTCLLAARWFA